MIDLIEQFRVEKLDVIPFLENNKLWNDTLKNCSYVPVAYSTMNINFVFECQNDKNIKIDNSSAIILWDNKPIALWPFYLKYDKKKYYLNFLDNRILSPLFVKNTPVSVQKKIIKRCFGFIKSISKRLKISSWECVELFKNKSDFSEWHLQSMCNGAKSYLQHELFVNLSLDISVIKSHFRKSYKSLISSGNKYWKLGIMDSKNEKLWKNFKDLHLKVSGKKTRSDKTWNIHYESILKNESFLIYLLDNKKRIVGGGLFNCSKDEGFYAVGAYDRSLFDKPLGHLVQYKAIEELKKRNISWYKIGLRNYETDTPNPSEKEISISKFKEGFATNVFPKYILTHESFNI